jgi:prolyl-tRNA synthetase
MEKDEKGLGAEKDDFSDWFSELIIKADLADYSEVSGCMVFKPASYVLWERIQKEVDFRFKKLGIKNAYFPLFIPEKFLDKEKEHVKGFSPEVAWVTQSGEKKLAERLAIRPTSEAIMYPSFSKWIRSWRDLPLRINQWNNVVRWEFKHPVPFFRTREFLWNELHTVLATEEEALAERKSIMSVYKEICEDYLALYGVFGRKTEREKFSGGVASWKFHYIMPNGKCAEGSPFHFDGQNFAKAYGVKFLDKDGKEQYAWQNTYAISTRLLGIMFAIHADNKGLIIPPKLAENKVVIVPILFEDSKESVLKYAEKLKKELEDFDSTVDDRDNYSAGYKFNEWELKGVPIRIEIGPKDIEKNQAVVVRRDNFRKESVKFSEIKSVCKKLLEEIQKELLDRSKRVFESKIKSAGNLAELKKAMAEKKVGIISLCADEGCEEKLKAETGGAKALWIDDSQKIKSEKCTVCGKKADYFIYAGKSY